MKKILLNILIAVTLTVGILGPVSATKIEAADSPESLINTTYCFKISEGLNLAGCSAITSYYTYSISASLLSVSGGLFDSLLSFGLSRNVLDQVFIEESWKNFRGFANILFILVLVIISVSIILDLGQFASKDLIKNVIIIALFVNFSLFAARAIIDVGNITALGFYDAIDVPNRTETLIQQTGLVDKNISGALLSSFNPARLVSVESYEAWKKNYVDGASLSGQSANLALTIIFSVATVMNVYMAYLFFMSGWIFVVRIVWLWFLMMVSPLAFVSYIIPIFKAKAWDRWWDELLNKSFCITAFLFFIWVTLTVTSSSFFKSAFVITADPSLLQLITIVLLQAILVFKLFSLSLRQMKKMCDDGGLGKSVLGMVKGAAGLAMGVATGGVGLAASGAIGGWASRAAKATEESGGGTTRLGKLRLQTLRKIEGASFAPSSAQFGKEGYRQRVERVAKENTEYMKSLPTEIKEPKRFGITGGANKTFPLLSPKTNDELVGKDAREIYRNNIKSFSPIAFMMGERKGEIKFTSGL